MSWELAAFFGLFLEAGYAIGYRKFAESNPHDALLSTMIMHILVVYPVGVAWALFDGGIDLRLEPRTWVFIGTAGLVFSSAKIISYIANSKIDAAQFALLGNTRLLVTIFVSTFFLNESLTKLQFVGSLLLLTAAGIAITAKINSETLKVTKYTFFTLGAAVLFGIGTSNESYLLAQMSFSTYFIVGWGAQLLFMLAFSFKKLKPAKKILTPEWIYAIIPVGLLRSLSSIAFVYSLQKSGNSSLFAAIFSYRTALIVAGSYFLLHEKEALKTKISATFTATLGLFTLRRGRS